MKPKVHISLVNWNTWKDCLNCVHSLAKLDTSGVEISISIVDNDSSDDSYERLNDALPKMDILPLGENNGYAAGHYENLNLARKLNADYFWILNIDTEIKPDALQAFLKVSREKGDHIYGSVTLKDEQTIDFAGASPESDRLNYNDWHGKNLSDFLQLHPSYNEVQSVEGSSIFLPMSLIEKHGFMKTDFFMYAEETDYCLRLKQWGIQSFVVSNSQIFHRNQGSFKGAERLKLVPMYYRRRNFLRLSMDFFGMSRWEALKYESSTIKTIKGVLKGIFGKKDASYYFALACFHAFAGIKGKKVEPEKFRN